jgi:hypothetical protein
MHFITKNSSQITSAAAIYQAFVELRAHQIAIQTSASERNRRFKM